MAQKCRVGLDNWAAMRPRQNRLISRCITVSVHCAVCGYSVLSKRFIYTKGSFIQQSCLAVARAGWVAWCQTACDCSRRPLPAAGAGPAPARSRLRARTRPLRPHYPHACSALATINDPLQQGLKWLLETSCKAKSRIRFKSIIENLSE